MPTTEMTQFEKSISGNAKYRARGLGKTVTKTSLMADPPPVPRNYPLISVDDHLVEPAHTFEGRLPAKFADAAPKIVRGDDGADRWHFTDAVIPMPMVTVSTVGRPSEEWSYDHLSYDMMRPGSYDIHHRVRDMDLDGIWASLAYPSSPFGFAGQRFLRMPDEELAHACLRAYNDWIAEEWAGSYPERIIPQGITSLRDPVLAAAEVRRNAERGFKAVAFSENPEKLGLPSLYSEHWHPLFAACEETGTVVNLHCGSSSEIIIPSNDSPIDVEVSLFGLNACIASVDWLYAGIPTLFPDIKICFAESGIGWVPMMLDRLHRTYRLQNPQTGAWTAKETPDEVFRRNYWFTALEDPTTLALRDQIGIDRIMYEADYPHADSSWPHTRDTIIRDLGHLPAEDLAKITHENASSLYRHPGPDPAWMAAGPAAA